MRPIDSIISASKLARTRVEVPECGLVLYFPPMTTAHRDAVHERIRAEQGLDLEHPARESDRQIQYLIEMAELEDGTKAFEPGDAIALRDNLPWPVLQRVLALGVYRSVIAGTTPEQRSESAKNE